MFKPVQRGKAVNLTKHPIGTVWIGSYTGKREIPKPDGKKTFIYEFQDQDDKTFEIWGFGALDACMENVLVGALCRITYKGKAEKRNKFGNFSTLCTVEINDDAEEATTDDAQEPIAF